MATLNPGFDVINALKEAPTPGERALLEYLEANLTDDYEVYFQPYFNGLRPDVVVMRRDWGVMIIEVKDWHLQSYNVNEKNEWVLKSNGARLMSPFQQVFGYKKSMFDLHIDGLAEAAAVNRGFYRILEPFVYFHNATRNDMDRLFAPAEQSIRKSRADLNAQHKSGGIDHRAYSKKMDYLKNKANQISRDRAMALSPSHLPKLKHALKPQRLFTNDIHEKFQRYLQPPFHTRQQGRMVDLGIKQKRLSTSQTGFSKVKGVAGSGKTTVLAKRAVDAHKRHGGRVLIMTFNLTLRNYIHDKISDVREDFSWGVFDIINYHSFINDQRRRAGCHLHENATFEEMYSDESMFDGHEDDLERYDSIFIDEIQDFQAPWVRIIRKYFLGDDAEMVLFGDEGQNIYERPVDRANPEIIRGFGRWERLTKSYRSQGDSPLTQLIADFQVTHLLDKYDIDTTEIETVQLSLDVLQYRDFDGVPEWHDLSIDIHEFLKKNRVHPNDVCVLCSEISPLRLIERAYKALTGEGTSTTFESQEVYEIYRNEIERRLRHNPHQFRDRHPGWTDDEILKHELERQLEKTRRSKKFHFWQNSGKIKLSTIHSYKGLEAQNIVYILGGKDSDEIVYTGITRSRRNVLMFLPRAGERGEFFRTRLTRWSD